MPMTFDTQTYLVKPAIAGDRALCAAWRGAGNPVHTSFHVLVARSMR
jgi:hypothetical protein